MEDYLVFVNGCGTVGYPYLHKLSQLGFRGDEIAASIRSLGSTTWEKGKKERLVNLLKRTGFDLYIANGENVIIEFENYHSFRPLNTVEKLFESSLEFGVIVDGTPDKRTAQDQKSKYYDKAKAKGVIFSGGSGFDLARNWLAVPGSSSDVNWNEYMNIKFVRQNSCNATYLGTQMALLSNAIDWNDVSKVTMHLNRRARDPSEKHKPLGVGKIVPPLGNGNTKYVRDIQAVLPQLKNVMMRALPDINPWEISHYNRTHIEFKEPVSGEFFSDVKNAFDDYPLCIVVDAEATLDMGYYDEMLKSKFRIFDGEISSPTYRLSFIADNEIVLDGFTPQMFIDTPSKLIYTLGKLGRIKSVSEGLELVAGNCYDGDYCLNEGVPIGVLNSELENLLNRHKP